MGRQRKKLNKGLAVFCAVFFFIVGALAGVLLKSIVLYDPGYEIPEKVTPVTSVSAGELDVNQIKNEDVSVHFMELGNKYTGDCTFIKVGDVEILIDAGSRASSVEPIYNYIWPYIDAGNDVLEYVIVTHAHQDHYAGFATDNSLFDLLEIETIIKFSKTNQKPTSKLYSTFINELNAEILSGTTVVTALDCYNNENGGQRIYDLGAGIGKNITLQILYQKYYKEEASSENDYSVCVMLNQEDSNDTEDGTRRYLFTGDLENQGESSLIAAYEEEYKTEFPKIDLYKAGHHGSKTSSSNKLLDHIQPKVVVVCACCGSTEYTTKNENTFPTQAFINRVSKWTDAVYVTTLCVDYKNGSFTSMNGHIVISFSSGYTRVKVSCANNTTKLKDTEWFKTNRTCPQAWSN